jgi:hypothetical protein
MTARKKKTARRRKGRVPPHLRRYLFKKGHRGARRARRRNPARKKRSGAGLRTYEQRITTVKRRKNPKRRRRNPSRSARARGWMLIAQGPGGRRLKYDGVKFSDHAKHPRSYPNIGAARLAATALRRAYGSVLHRYSLYAAPMMGK